MATVETSRASVEVVEQVKVEWLDRLSTLVDTVCRWGESLGWATRRIETKLKDSLIGTHIVPALLLQDGTTRIILQPVGRSAIGAEGVVELYVMPAYDDIATLYYHDGCWYLNHAAPGQPNPVDPRQADRPLTEEVFQDVLNALIAHES